MSTPVMKLFDLAGQHALVTGGSRGLGLQIAEALGEAGAKIMLTSRKAGDLEEAAADLHAEQLQGLVAKLRGRNVLAQDGSQWKSQAGPSQVGIQALVEPL